MKNWREVTEEEYLEHITRNYPRIYHTEDTTQEKPYPLVCKKYDSIRAGDNAFIGVREVGRITYGEPKKWFLTMTQEEVAAHNDGVMKAIFKDKDPGEVQEQAEREDWESEPAAKKILKLTGKMLTIPIESGLTLEEAKEHLKDAAENRTMGIGIDEIMRKQQGN